MKGGIHGEEVFILDVAGFLHLTVNTRKKKKNIDSQ